MRPALLALLLAFPATYSLGADVHGDIAAKIRDPELRDMTQKVLREMGTDYDALAKKGLTAKGERFDLARVEITGVGSNDNTYKVNQRIFDAQIKPSFTNDENSILGNLRRGIKLGYEYFAPNSDPISAFQKLHDSVEFERAAAGETTARAREVLADYKHLEINEIVAHSWGTELVYAAILNGELRPPKKLIVVGVPDDDHAKWEMLAARTGTEVHWVRAPNDLIAKAGAHAVSRQFPVDYKARWDALCSDPVKGAACRAHNRKPKSVVWEEIGDIAGAAGHDRVEYYSSIETQGILKGSVLELRAAETAVKEAEIREVKKAALEVAVRAARTLISEARAQREISRRDHDERLRGSMIDIAVRACTAPERVNQAELDALPEPYDADFVNIAPDGMGACTQSVYRDLRRGADLREILDKAATFEEPAALRPERPALPAQPVDALIRPSPFALTFPDLARFAIASCRSPGSAAPVPMNYYQRPYAQFYGDRKNWEGWYTNQLALLDGCPKLLFIDLVTLALEGSYWKVGERDWIKNQVARYSPSQGGPGGGASPGGGNAHPPSGGDPCRDNGNIRCP